MEEVSVLTQSRNRLPPVTLCVYPPIHAEIPFSLEDEGGAEYLCPNTADGNVRNLL